LEKSNEQLQFIIAELEGQLAAEKARSESLAADLVSEREESARLRDQIGRLDQLLKDQGQKRDDDAKKIKDLEFQQIKFEEDIETLKSDVEGFKVKLDQEKDETNNVRKVVDEKAGQDAMHRKGLQVLKRNLDLHLEDLSSWQKYLELDDKTTFDFEREIKPTILAELGDQEFIAQLETLSNKLDQENEAMLKIFKQKKLDSQAQKISQAKSK